MADAGGSVPVHLTASHSKEPPQTPPRQAAPHPHYNYMSTPPSGASPQPCRLGLLCFTKGCPGSHKPTWALCLRERCDDLMCPKLHRFSHTLQLWPNVLDAVPDGRPSLEHAMSSLLVVFIAEEEQRFYEMQRFNYVGPRFRMIMDARAYIDQRISIAITEFFNRRIPYQVLCNMIAYERDTFLKALQMPPSPFAAPPFAPSHYGTPHQHYHAVPPHDPYADQTAEIARQLERAKLEQQMEVEKRAMQKEVEEVNRRKSQMALEIEVARKAIEEERRAVAEAEAAAEAQAAAEAERRRRLVEEATMAKQAAEEKLALSKMLKKLKALQKIQAQMDEQEARRLDIEIREGEKLLKENARKEDDIRDFLFKMSKIVADRMEYDNSKTPWSESGGWTPQVELKRHQFSLKASGDDWEFSETSATKLSVRIRTSPFESGSFRFCFYAQLSDGRRMVAKAFISERVEGVALDKNTLLKDAKDQMRIHMIASEYAKQFSSIVSSGTMQVSYVDTYLLTDLGSAKPFNNHSVWFLEPVLDGDFEKYNNNKDRVVDAHSVPQAFTHFSWHKSGKKSMVVDVQGMEDKGKKRYLLTDPALHSVGHTFGDTDLGEEGFDHYFKVHKCNDVCKQLKLPRHRAQSK